MTFALFFSGEFSECSGFVKRHPEVMLHLITLGLSAACGQFFIFMMITNFGSLANSIVTTSRKFFTVLISVFVFGNHLTIRQWMGTVLVFSGLFYDMFLGKKVPKTNVILSEVKTGV